jgi:hypothetical protein
VRKSAENTEKAYEKARNAAGAVRVEEAKLEDLRSKGGGATAVLQQSEKLVRARRAEVTTTRTAVAALRDLDTAQVTAAASGSALSNLFSGIASGAAGSRLGGVASSVESLSTKLSGAGLAAGGAAKTQRRWPVQRRAVAVERRPVPRLVAHPAGPGGVAATLAEARLMSHEHLVGPERVPVGASRRRVGDPLPGRGLHEIAEHPIKPRPRGNHPRSGLALGAVPP